MTSAWSPAAWYEFDLGDGAAVEAGQTYAIIYRAASATAGAPLYYWINTSGAYDGGRLLAGFSGSSWSALRTWDAAFKETGTTSVDSEPGPEEPVISEQESSTDTNAIDVFSGSSWRAQTFTPETSYDLTSVSLPLLRTGDPEGDITVSIRATDSAGLPTGNDLATAGIAAGSVGSEWTPVTWYEFDLDSTVSVEAGTTYAIVWRAESASSATPVPYWINTSAVSYTHLRAHET